MSTKELVMAAGFDFVKDEVGYRVMKSKPFLFTIWATSLLLGRVCN